MNVKSIIYIFLNFLCIRYVVCQLCTVFYSRTDYKFNSLPHINNNNVTFSNFLVFEVKELAVN